MVGRSVSTLQRWDGEGVVPAKRTQTDRRYYTHEDHLVRFGLESRARMDVDADM